MEEGGTTPFILNIGIRGYVDSYTSAEEKGGKLGTNYRGPKIRKEARGHRMLQVLLSFLVATDTTR
jgi:hypothetical protein